MLLRRTEKREWACDGPGCGARGTSHDAGPPAGWTHIKGEAVVEGKRLSLRLMLCGLCWAKVRGTLPVLAPVAERFPH